MEKQLKEQNEEYFAWLYDLQNNLFLENMSDLATLMDELYIKKAELEERLDNLSEELKESEFASLLETRIEYLENIYSELDEISSEEKNLSDELVQYIKTLISDIE